MAQDYDKVIKENIESIILPLVGKLLDIHPEKMTAIALDLQKTIERKPDFLKRILENDREYVLHIEFQLRDDAGMVYRMLEYKALLMRKYRIPIRQFVFFMGDGLPRMATEISEEGLHYFFQIKNLREISYRRFIESDKPEEVILSILADFPPQESAQIIRRILQRLRETSATVIDLRKFVIQLEILSKARNLQQEVTKQTAVMPFEYDIETDIRFMQGVEKGMEKEKVETVREMLKDRIPMEKIAKYCKVDVAFVEQVRKDADL